MNQYINLITFLLPIIFSPGPNNIMMASMGKSTVNKKNIPFIIGVELILIFYVLLACTGGSNIVEFVKSNNSILSLFGAGYFLYLSIILFKSKENEEVEFGDSFKSGVIFGLCNYKVIYGLIFTQSAILALSINVSTGVLSFTFIVMGILSHALWFILGRKVYKFVSSQKKLKVINMIFGFIMFYFSMSIIWSLFI